MPKNSLRAAARLMSRARKHPSGGHQGRKPGAISRTKPRCPCGKMTLKRAQARGRSREHDPDCLFHPLISEAKIHSGQPGQITREPGGVVRSRAPRGESPLGREATW